MLKKICGLFLIFSLFLMLNGCNLDTPILYGSIENEVNMDNLKIHTEYITNTIGIRPGGTAEEVLTANYIQGELEMIGFAVNEGTLIRTGFTSINGTCSENVIAVCNSNKSKEVIDIVAHYDSVPTSPGARDNAAGVAALLEIARILGPDCEYIENEIRFIFVGAEEMGYFGSTAYVNSLSETEKLDHIAAFIMDISITSVGEGAVLNCNTLGGRMGDQYVEGNWLYPANNLVSRSITAAICEINNLIPDDNGDKFWSPRHKGESDHFSFHNGGIDAGNICWRKIDGEFALLPDEYHEMSDTTENLDYSTLKITVQCILLAIKLICSKKIV